MRSLEKHHPPQLSLRKSYDALSLPLPDTFAGRKTQEPFPQQHEDSLVEGWLTSKELQPGLSLRNMQMICGRSSINSGSF